MIMKIGYMYVCKTFNKSEYYILTCTVQQMLCVQLVNIKGFFLNG